MKIVQKSRIIDAQFVQILNKHAVNYGLSRMVPFAIPSF